MNQKSPFEQWRENHLYQIAVSPEILKLIAEAFQGGRLYEMQPFQKRTWVGLTSDEILDLFDINNVYGSKWIEFARCVEAKLKDKNCVG
jgi:hypothetical protein